MLPLSLSVHCVYACMYVCLTCTYVYAFVHVFPCVCVCVSMCAYMCVCVCSPCVKSSHSPPFILTLSHFFSLTPVLCLILCSQIDPLRMLRKPLQSKYMNPTSLQHFWQRIPSVLAEDSDENGDNGTDRADGDAVEDSDLLSTVAVVAVV